jgi:hypothetical protein
VEHFGAEGAGDGLIDFRLRGPDVAEVDGFAVGAEADGFDGEIDVHAAGEGVGDDQRGAGEIIGFDVRIDAALEIAVAGEDGGGDEIAAFSMMLETASGSGPLLPMQVVQP